jgi:hypothetical protein
MSRMSARAGVIALVVSSATLAAGNVARAIEPDFSPPTATTYSQDFDGVHGIPQSWQVALGRWSADGQTYNSTTAASAAVTTIFEYIPLNPASPPEGTLFASEFTFAARLRSEKDSGAAVVGLVYLYVDPSNYHEVVFSPTGIAYLRFMSGGHMETLATATYQGGGQRAWFGVELKRSRDAISVSVNGVPVFTGVAQPDLFKGQVGLSSYNTTAKFNKVSISLPYGQQPFTENFSDGVADGFTSPEGTFVVSNGTFVDTAVHKIGRAFAPVSFGVGSQLLFNYTLHVRMLNPYGGPGNLMGILFDTGSVDSKPAFQEVVFSPTGVAQIRRVVGDTIQVLHSAPLRVGRNQWFEVTFVMDAELRLSVNINGEPLFIREHALLFGAVPPHALALVTHWTPGRFDDLDFGFVPPTPSLLLTFDGPLLQAEVKSGTWDTEGGTLNNVSAGVADIVLPTGTFGDTDYSYKARLLNQYGSSGNRIGLIFSYSSAEDYLEVVFAPTGQAYLNLVMEGTKYPLATATHTVPRNVWFNVELLRKGTSATVTLNGKPIFQNVQVGQLGGGALGVVSHWAKARFDNLATKQVP